MNIYKSQILNFLMKALFIGFTLCIFTLMANGQVTFHKLYGDSSYSAQAYTGEQTFDGGFLAAGQNYILKTDMYGIVLWIKFVNNFRCNSIKQIADSGFVLFGNGSPLGASYPDYQIIKIDHNGNIIWLKSFDNGSGTQDRGFSIFLTSDGGYIMTGEDEFPGYSGSALIRTDANGDTLWTRKYYNSHYGQAVIQTTDSGYVVLGIYNWLKKINKFGNTIWSKEFPLSGSSYTYDIAQTADGGFVIGGQTDQIGAGFIDALLIKVDSSGNFQWSKTYGGTGVENLTSLDLTADGGIVFTGVTRSVPGTDLDILVVKTDSAGNLEWSKVYGGSEYEYSWYIQQTTDNGFFIAGGLDTITSGTSLIYLIKTDSMGNSGCNEISHSLIQISQSITIGNYNEIDRSGFIITSPSYSLGVGGLESTLCFSTGISNLSNTKSDLTIFPNPSSNYIEIKYGEMILSGILDIYDSFGNAVLVKDIKNSYMDKINIETFTNGLYIVRVCNANTILTCKFLVN
jgi:Secretion system C-terminal sorting domain